MDDLLFDIIEVIRSVGSEFEDYIEMEYLDNGDVEFYCKCHNEQPILTIKRMDNRHVKILCISGITGYGGSFVIDLYDGENFGKTMYKIRSILIKHFYELKHCDMNRIIESESKMLHKCIYTVQRDLAEFGFDYDDLTCDDETNRGCYYINVDDEDGKCKCKISIREFAGNVIITARDYDDWDCKKRIPFGDYEKESLFDFLHQIFHNDL